MHSAMEQTQKKIGFEDSPKLRANFMAQKTVTKVLPSYSAMRSSYAAEFKLNSINKHLIYAMSYKIRNHNLLISSFHLHIYLPK
jgi:hypothetical protein